MDSDHLKRIEERLFDASYAFHFFNSLSQEAQYNLIARVRVLDTLERTPFPDPLIYYYTAREYRVIKECIVPIILMMMGDFVFDMNHNVCEITGLTETKFTELRLRVKKEIFYSPLDESWVTMMKFLDAPRSWEYIDFLDFFYYSSLWDNFFAMIFLSSS